MIRPKPCIPLGRVAGTLLLLAAFCTSLLLAGTTGKIAGRVSDRSTGASLMGANVFILGTTTGASADKDGLYFIINVPPGVYSVRATYMGYEILTQSEVRVMVDRTTMLDFTLMVTAIEGAEVTVVAERPVVDTDLTASMQVVTPSEIDRSWARSIPELLETQTGVFQGHFRGGNLVESVYMLDNVSMNSGLLSDNFTGINTSTIQEIALLTGGYNAEYGTAQSGIINITTKDVTPTEGKRGLHGTFIGRMRPAGKYHWGSNFYSKDSYDYQHFNHAYWDSISQNVRTDQYYGQDPDTLLAMWLDQITPDPIQGDYAERPEYETEVTLYGPITRKLGFMFSGRYKRGVNIFPQATEYNPEYNLQSKLAFRATSALKLELSGFFGGYTTSSMSPSNFNTLENSQEMAWNGFPQIIDPYDWDKYSILGSWAGWPEVRTASSLALKINHTLSPRTYYEIDISYLYDKMDKTDRDNVVPDSLWSFDDEEYGMRGHYLVNGYSHWEDWFRSQIYSIRGAITSQVTNIHLIKAGFEAKTFNFHYDHFMPAWEGGWKWNLINIYDGTPYEGSFYGQDKIELPGLIVNAGLRADFFNQNREAPAYMFDPLALDSTTAGNELQGWPGDPEMVKTKLQVAFAPRLGISHPIGENTVLHFVYGHFYQRPSWHKMFSFPVCTYTDSLPLDRDPWLSGVERNPDVDPATPYMPQWQGPYGNPELGYERTIQYEIGVDWNIADLIRLDITGYYKDASRQTVFREGTLYDPRWDDLTTWTWVVDGSPNNVDMIVETNSAFADIRGIEARLDTRFRTPLNVSFSYDLNFASGGVAGYWILWEPGEGINPPKSYAQQKKAWNRNSKFKGIMNLSLPEAFGPSLLGFRPLGDINANLFYEYWSGPQYTYHGPDDTTAAGLRRTEPNNRRWFGHHRTNLRVSKGINLLGTRAEISMEVRNLFNNRDLNMLWDDDLELFHEKTELTEEEREQGLTLEEAKLPTHWWSGEPDRWGWYNNWTNPPRQIYFQLRIDF